MIKLIFIDEDEKSIYYDFNKKNIRLGREATNDIVLKKTGVSRMHCEIREDDGEFYIRDLKSTNGTYLNNEKISEARLYPGDQIQVGGYVFKFTSEIGSKKTDISDETSSIIEIIRTVDKLEAKNSNDTSIDDEALETTFDEEIDVLKNDYKKLRKGYQKLIMFFDLSNVLIKIASNEELLANLEDTLLEEFNYAERIAIFINNENSDMLELVKEKSKIVLSDSEKPLPYDLIKKSVETNKAFNAIEAVVSSKRSKEKTTEHRIMRTMMIAPMSIKEKPIGVLYVENWSQPYCFQDFDLELLNSFANQIGIAFENNSLYERLDKAYEKAYADFLSEYLEKRKAVEEIQRHLQRITTLNKINEALASRLSPNELYPLIFEKIRNVIPTDAFFITYFESLEKEPTTLIYFDTVAKKIVQVDKKPNLPPDIFTQILKDKKPILLYYEEDAEDLKNLTNKPLSLIYVPMILGDNVVGILSVQSYQKNIYDESHLELLQNIANQSALFIENARLFDNLKKQQISLENLSSEIIKTQENERKRISRELHDGIGQILTAIKINLEIRKNKKEVDIKKIAKETEENIKLIERVIEDLRRISHDLRPSMLDDFGLLSTIQSYVKDYEQLTGLQVVLNLDLQNKEAFLPDQEINLFRIIQEGLSNIAKHSKATKASIKLFLSNGEINLEIEDNGIGFDINKIEDFQPKDFSFGLLNMKERCKILGGELKIISHLNKGTKLFVKFPIPNIKNS